MIVRSIKKNAHGIAKIIFLVVSCFTINLSGYIVSLAYYEGYGKKIIVLGDRHVKGYLDQQHGDFFLKFLRHFHTLPLKNSFIIEAHKRILENVYQENTAWDLSLIRVARYCSCVQNDQHTIIFSDPRLAVKNFYKVYMNLSHALDILALSHPFYHIADFADSTRSLNEVSWLLDEIEFCVGQYEQKMKKITDLMVKQFIQAVLFRLKSTHQQLKQFFAKYTSLTIYDSLIKALHERKEMTGLTDLQEPILHANLDLADLSFCLDVYEQLATDAEHIVILVGHDHTVRINHMLELLKYKKINPSKDTSSYLEPLTIDELKSYLEPVFA